MKNAAYESQDCSVNDLSIDRSSDFAKVTANITNKTNDISTFSFKVSLLNDKRETIGLTYITAVDVPPGESRKAELGEMQVDENMVMSDEAATIDRVKSMEVTLLPFDAY